MVDVEWLDRDSGFWLVVPEKVLWTDTSFGYAAHWAEYELQPGTYPLLLATIDYGRPFRNSDVADGTFGVAYYAIAKVDSRWVNGHRDLYRGNPREILPRWQRFYRYQLEHAKPALWRSGACVLDTDGPCAWFAAIPDWRPEVATSAATPINQGDQK